MRPPRQPTELTDDAGEKDIVVRFTFGNKEPTLLKPSGLFARIEAKVAAFTVLPYINLLNHKPIGKVKYALF